MSERMRGAGIIDRLIAEAHEDGYRAGLAHAEAALYSGMDALVELLGGNREPEELEP